MCSSCCLSGSGKIPGPAFENSNEKLMEDDSVLGVFKEQAGDFFGDIFRTATENIKPIKVETDSNFKLSTTTIVLLLVGLWVVFR